MVKRILVLIGLVATSSAICAVGNISGGQPNTVSSSSSGVGGVQVTTTVSAQVLDSIGTTLATQNDLSFDDSAEAFSEGVSASVPFTIVTSGDTPLMISTQAVSETGQPVPQTIAMSDDSSIDYDVSVTPCGTDQQAVDLGGEPTALSAGALSGQGCATQPGTLNVDLQPANDTQDQSTGTSTVSVIIQPQ